MNNTINQDFFDNLEKEGVSVTTSYFTGQKYTANS